MGDVPEVTSREINILLQYIQDHFRQLEADIASIKQSLYGKDGLVAQAERTAETFKRTNSTKRWIAGILASLLVGLLFLLGREAASIYDTYRTAAPLLKQLDQARPPGKP